ncbi:MAG: LytTR family DNA-binding domain-containing protein [Acidobacteriota bacterium]
MPEPSRLKALVVDDEPIARKILREELADLNVEVVGEADTGTQAVKQIASLIPDLVFLDLQMPGGGGFDVIRQLEGTHPLPSIVIVTAFDQHAIEAFDAGAIDYLLKPVGRERLVRCLDRVRQIRGSGRATAEQSLKLQELATANVAGPRPRKFVGKLIVRHSGHAREEFYLLDHAQILAFQVEEESVWIVTRKQRYLATQTLKHIDEKLTGLNFARIHRSTLVNLDHVTKITPLTSRRWLLTLANDQEFIVSKRQASAIEDLLK